MSFSYMPFYTGDYLRDTRHLSMAEHGAYIQLLMHCWDQKGPAPLDERRLYGIVNARSGDEIEAMRRVLAEFFVRMDDGWYNKRMQEEIARAEAMSASYRDAGLKSGEIRRARSAARESAAAPQRTEVQPRFNQGSTSVGRPTPIPIPIQKTNTSCGNSAQKPAELPPGVAVVETDPTPKPDPIPYDKIVELYHQILPMCPRVQNLTQARRAQIRARMSGTGEDRDIDDLQEWALYFEQVAKSKFLTGRIDPAPGRRRFIADLEWLTKEANFTKVLERRYD